MIDARMAADLLGATPMDRPEDAQPRGDGTVYLMLTNNSRRKAAQVDAANPRDKNRFGHIIEIKEDGGDHGAERGTWSILVRCGDPAVAEVGAVWNPDTSKNGWFGSPDNAAMDAQGRLWVAPIRGATGPRQANQTASTGSRPKGQRAARPSCFSAVLWAAKCVAPISPRIRRRCLSLSNTLERTGRRILQDLTARPHSRTLQPAGPTLIPPCPRALRFWL